MENSKKRNRDKDETSAATVKENISSLLDRKRGKGGVPKPTGLKTWIKKGKIAEGGLYKKRKFGAREPATIGSRRTLQNVTIG